PPPRTATSTLSLHDALPIYKLYGPDEGIFFKLAESGGAPAPRGQFDDLIMPDERRALRHHRQALHASELALPHPVTGDRMRFESDRKSTRLNSSHQIISYAV